MICCAFLLARARVTALVHARGCTDPRCMVVGMATGQRGRRLCVEMAFASVTPAARAATGGNAGVLTTHPLLFGHSGGSSSSSSADAFLFVNVVAPSAGDSLTVELLTGGVISKVSTKMSQVDATRLRVQWSNATLGLWPSPSSQPQLRLTLRGNVSLFSFWLTQDERCGSSGGPVAAQGAAASRVGGTDHAPMARVAEWG